jgi:sugar lactone lactonase YvrE
VGSLCLTGASSAETLAVVDSDGRVTELDDDLTLSNGLAWTADGTLLYSVDTLRQCVYRRAYDPQTGTAAQRTVFLKLRVGFPDGICLDAEEHLWVAVSGLGQVRRYTPAGSSAGSSRCPRRTRRASRSRAPASTRWSSRRRHKT